MKKQIFLRREIFLFFIPLAIIFSSCSATQPVRVLKGGETKISASLGGPFIPFSGTKIPFPNLHAGIMHGCSDNWTLMADAHLHMLLTGTFGFDVGAAYPLYRSEAADDSPSLHVTALGKMYVLTDFQKLENLRFFPTLTLNASWELGKTTLIYTGLDNTFQISKPSWIASPLLGIQFGIGEKSSLQFEAKWMAANVKNEQNVFEGANSIDGFGAPGIFFGYQYGW